MSLNICAVMGRLTREVDLRQASTGNAVATFSLAVDRDRQNENGERDADFIDCVAFGKSAEHISKYFSKGQRMVAVGRLQIRRWVDTEGNNRRHAEIAVQSVYFADAPRKPQESSYTDQASGYAPDPSAVIQDAYDAMNRMKSASNSGFTEVKEDDGELPF